MWSEGSPLTVAGAAAVSHRIPFSPRCRGTVGFMLIWPGGMFQARVSAMAGLEIGLAPVHGAALPQESRPG
jgi:hypothetical protein